MIFWPRAWPMGRWRRSISTAAANLPLKTEPASGLFEIPWITFAFELVAGALDQRGRADRAPSLKDAVKQSVHWTGGAGRRKRRTVPPCMTP
jgi:hypothetical protein